MKKKAEMTKILAAVLLAAAVLPQAVSAIAAANSRAVILVIFMFLTSF